MQTVQFLGRVLPPVFQVSVPKIDFNWEAADLGLKLSYTITIDKSSVHVSCETNRFEPDDMVPIWMRAFDLVRGAVDLVCFEAGIGATVILDTMINPDGIQSTILPQDRNLAGICTAFRLNQSQPSGYAEILAIVLQEPALFMALNDLITAITLPHHSSVTCVRAIERIRHLISPGAETKVSWIALRAALNIDKEYLKFMTDYSTKPRHGAPGHIPGKITSEVTKRAWNVMNRYLEFRKLGNTPLPLSDFPILTG